MLYLDYNATTPLDPRVKGILMEALEVFGNPSSLHRPGQKARFLLEEARERVAAACGRRPEEVIFTASATEALNLAILGFARAHPGVPVAVCRTEHPAARRPAEMLEGRGHPIFWIGVDREGQILLDDLDAALDREAGLVVIQAASGETGVIQPWEEIARRVEKAGAFWLADAAQIPGKEDLLAVGRLAHLLVISSHKVYGPRGVAALIRPVDLEIEPLMWGGEQEGGLRPGTEVAPLAWAFAEALEVAQQRLHEDRTRMQAFRARLEAGLLDLNLPVIARNRPRLPNTTMFLSPGRDGVRMVAALDVRGMAVSSSSACITGRAQPSPTLMAMGYTASEARRVVRVSAGRWTEPEEADRFLQALQEVLNV